MKFEATYCHGPKNDRQFRPSEDVLTYVRYLTIEELYQWMKKFPVGSVFEVITHT